MRTLGKYGKLRLSFLYNPQAAMAMNRTKIVHTRLAEPRLKAGRESGCEVQGYSGELRAWRHSHISGLVRSGAPIMEAKELARHADIR